MNNIEVRKICRGEEEELWMLFYNTIHTINTRDYNDDQIAAWAPKDFDINIAIQKFIDIDPFVAIKDGMIVGYADIQTDGYIDHFYCHHKYQSQGVGRKLFSALEKEAKEKGIYKMYSNVSITARPFFEAMGFGVEKEQVVKVRDQKLKNYRMVRQL
ncbi:acetyltransferase [Thiohalobacter sp. COW1]|uniref:GNAT family N-acetyltransferase n=1 Tax=Thiohalobacter sp. COW1 TaxID=2795687 RepID=UPI001916BEA3|nr:GNAT family N-acetyltransferase [Thiohalobacter sp. COW1]BCO32605.1 acetyltransferase [Thiohalobacter sp. COW1]